MLALIACLLAAEPFPVLQYRVVGTSGPPAEPCTTTATVVSPGGPEPTPAASADAEPDPSNDTATMLRVDLAPSAPNDGLPADVRARLAPPDLATLPLEPLRGRPDDLVTLRARISSAAVRDRPLRVAFWGASHVAGEFLTGEIRRLLQDRYGDAGHGFVMPAAPWKGYRASDVNLCSSGTWASDFDHRQKGRRDGRYGPAGFSVEASDPAAFGWVETTRENLHGRKVSTFEVMFYKQKAGGTLLARVDDSAVMEVPTAGDGPGLAVIRVQDGPHRLRLAPKGDGPVRLFGVHMERDGQGVVLDAMGVPGKTMSSWQRWDAEIMGMYLARREPDVAVLAYGTNEANDRALTPEKYRASLTASLTRMRELVPDAACVLVGPSDRGRKLKGSTHVVWGPTSWVAAVQREVGPDFGCSTWDLQAATGGPGSVFGWRAASPTLMAQDLIHFSAAGYQELGRRFVRNLQGEAASP